MAFIPDFSDMEKPNVRLYQVTLQWRERPIRPYNINNPAHNQGELVHQQLLICAENSQEAESIARQRMPYYTTTNRNAISDPDANIRIVDYGQPLPRRVYQTTPVIPKRCLFQTPDKKAIQRVLVEDPKSYLDKLAQTMQPAPATPDVNQIQDLEQELAHVKQELADSQAAYAELSDSLSETPEVHPTEFQPTCDDYADIAEVYTHTFAAILHNYPDLENVDAQIQSAYNKLADMITSEQAEPSAPRPLLSMIDVFIHFITTYETQEYLPNLNKQPAPMPIRQFIQNELAQLMPD